MDLHQGPPLSRVGVLAPCDGLADFPTYFRGDDAGGLLSAWTVAWRPGLLAATGRTPDVVSAYEAPDSARWRSGLLLVPPPCIGDPIEEWVGALRSDDSNDGSNDDCRDGDLVVVESPLLRTDLIAAIESRCPSIPQASPELDREFYALAYAYLQVAKLAELGPGSGVFDAGIFESAAVEAANAAVDGDLATAGERLDRCYDQLLQARNHRYPLEVLLLDILLTADSTPADAIAREAGAAHGTTLLLSGKNADRLAREPGDGAKSIRKAIAAERLAAAAGAYHDGVLARLTPPELWEELIRGFDAVERLVGRRPRCFGQRLSPACPRLPQALGELGCGEALLASFDGGGLPSSERGRSTWVGPDGSALEAAVAAPFDFSQPESFLALHEPLRETLERDYTATLLLAGWPGTRSESMGDLRRVAQRSEVLGRFVTLEEYFDTSQPADHWGEFAVAPPNNQPESPDRCSAPLVERDRFAAGLLACAKRLAGAATGAPNDPSAAGVLADAASVIGSGEASRGNTAELRINPWGFALPGGTGKPTPPLGFSTERPDSHPLAVAASEQAVENAALIARVHETSGGLQALRTRDVRRNRGSQRLLIGRPRSGSPIGEMVADSVEAQTDGGFASVTSRGKIVDRRGRVLADFEQTVQLSPGADWLLIDSRLSASDSSAPMPAGCEAVCRFALGDGDWKWSRGVQWSRLPAPGLSFFAGQHATAQAGAQRVTIACDHPSVFRRVGGGQIDAVLPLTAKGLTNIGTARRRFALSLSDRPPLETHLAAFGGVLAGPVSLPAKAPPSGWWLHSSASGVVIQPLGPANDGDSVRLRLIETEGRAATTKLRLCRPIASARLVAFDRSTSQSLEVVDGLAVVEIGPHGWLQVEASW